jgi:hypothetical protein
MAGRGQRGRSSRRQSRATPPSPTPTETKTPFQLFISFFVTIFVAIKKGVIATGKGTWTALKAIGNGIVDAGKWTNKEVDKLQKWYAKKAKLVAEEGAVLYLEWDTWTPDQNAWWVKFIRESKLPALKETVKKDVRIHNRSVQQLSFYTEISVQIMQADPLNESAAAYL